MPGILLSAIIAVPASVIGRRFPVIGSPILGIIIGMLISFWKRPAYFEQGISFSSKYILQYSIILLGFNMNLYTVFEVGSQTVWLILLTTTATFIAASAIGKLLKLETNTTVLIGVGTAICGGSAIAATAPAIDANSDDVARSISTIFLFNIIAALTFPALGHLLQMSDYDFGLWAGTAINDTSAVVAAGYSFSESAGDLAVIVKLARTLLIVPITCFLAMKTMRNKTSNKSNGCTSKYKISHVFPWFILGFVAASMMNTFLPIPTGVKECLLPMGKYMIVIAMTAVGLNTNIAEMTKGSWKPIVLGLGCWITLSITSLLLQYLLL